MPENECGQVLDLLFEGTDGVDVVVGCCGGVGGWWCGGWWGGVVGQLVCGVWGLVCVACACVCVWYSDVSRGRIFTLHLDIVIVMLCTCRDPVLIGSGSSAELLDVF